jgi:hypothetical protein
MGSVGFAIFAALVIPLGWWILVCSAEPFDVWGDDAEFEGLITRIQPLETPFSKARVR